MLGVLREFFPIDASGFALVLGNLRDFIEEATPFAQVQRSVYFSRFPSYSTLSSILHSQFPSDF